MPITDAVLLDLAGPQHGLVTRSQARERGFTDRMLRRRVGNGLLVPLSSIVFRLAGTPATWHQRLLAACWSGGPTSLASHRSAAALHRFDGFRCGALEVTVDRDRYYRAKGVRVHTSTDLAVQDYERIEGIPVTTPLRTLIDLGAVVHRHRLEEALDAAERDGLVDRAELRWLLAVVRWRGRNGVGPIAALLEHRSGNQPRSVLERKLLRLLERAGLPRPHCQYRVTRPDGQLADLDFAYPEHKVAIEVDGHIGHATRRQRRNDNRRGNQIVLSDWRILRFTYEEVMRQPAYVVETVRAALALSGDVG